MSNLRITGAGGGITPEEPRKTEAKEGKTPLSRSISTESTDSPELAEKIETLSSMKFANLELKNELTISWKDELDTLEMTDYRELTRKLSEVDKETRALLAGLHE